MLVGNKCDMTDERVIQERQVQDNATQVLRVASENATLGADTSLEIESGVSSEGSQSV